MGEPAYRSVVRSLLLFGCSLALLHCGPTEHRKYSPRSPNPVEIENQRPGTSTWALARPAVARQVEGYASRISMAAGETVDIHVNVDDQRHAVTWELYRVGYYAGLGARLMSKGGPVDVSPQPPCPVTPATGLVECQWAAAFTLETDANWVSGYYLTKLVRDDGFDVYVPFVLREATPRAPVLSQASVTTWEAYNNFGGTSLYGNSLPSPQVFTHPEAFQVSFDRPFDALAGANVEPQPDSEAAAQMGAASFFRFELPTVLWLEKSGYDVAYTTNVDVTEQPDTVIPRRLFLSVGHDEYWTVPERAALDFARDYGVSLAFLSANTSYWRIRLEPSSSGVPDRVITCYKASSSTLDPHAGMPDQTANWRVAPYANPENELVGVMYQLYTRFDALPLVVTNPNSWVFEGMGLAPGDSIGHLVGYEWDHVFDNGFSPAGLDILGSSPAFGVFGNAVQSNMTVYAPTSENFVFAGGTIEFGWGLGKPGYANGRTERVFDNLMARVGVPPETPADLDPDEPGPKPGSAASVTAFAGSGEPGFRDGSAASAQFDAPAGIAAGPDGSLYVTDVRNNRIRVISPSMVVSTLAGCGPTGVTTGQFENAVGNNACFSAPTGIALGPDGALYVADSGNSAIRRVTLDGAVTTYAGTGTSGKMDGSLALATFSHPEGVAFGPDGTMYVADSGNDSIRAVSPSGVTTIASGLSWPTGITVGSDGTVYVAATQEGRLYSINAGVVSILANQMGVPGDQDGPADTARLRPACGIAPWVNEIVFSDAGNDTVRVYDPASAVVTRLAGTGRPGSALGSGNVAEVSLPRGLAVVAGGIVLVDSGNNRLVKITATPLLSHG